MLTLFIGSKLVVDLSDKQQEFIIGGADFELSSSNFANRFVILQGLTFSGPSGSFANSSAQTSAINTAAQDLLGLRALRLPRIGGLGLAPILF
ncbi:CTB family bacteriocin [Cronbergia sp. UHCC 0137]|uniref:CTB family bacteriocin n=1 Tax=Cronbergia sp. UHCC 0137 TaxID=3110239 RepID=UPI002B20E4F9|nr:CTB family bacteriocin [Cronbergia sp. UHCC 0137]MEA5618589.1 CTB family bacteriocin [Cronbergia sp. UHCC 0137]